MRFGPGSELEQWLHERHLFAVVAIILALLAVLIVVLADAWTAPEPFCGRNSVGAEECKLQVEYGS